MGIKKSALQSLILHSNQFVKNIQTCDIGALKWKKLGKSQNFLVFSSNYSLFCKMVFPINMAWKDESLDAHNDIFKEKNTLSSVFFFLSQEAICDCQF